MSTIQDTDLLLVNRGGIDYKATVEDFKDGLSAGGGVTALSFLGSHWTNGLATSLGPWKGVCWSPKLGLFAAVSSGATTGQVMTSPDGYTWTAHTAMADNWQDICWSEEKSLFVAVGAGSGTRLMTSPDGITWTGRSITPDAHALYSVCWAKEAGKFVALGRESGYATIKNSVDGVTWTNHSTTGYTPKSVCWSPKLSLFAAAAGGGVNLTSTDGEVWTSRTIPAGFEPAGICWSEERSLFVSSGSTSQPSNSNIAYSSDGINWTGVFIGATTDSWGDVIWVGERGIFIAAANGKVATSPDGKAWTIRPMHATGNVASMAWSPALQKVVAVPSSGSLVSVSPGF